LGRFCYPEVAARRKSAEALTKVLPRTEYCAKAVRLTLVSENRQIGDAVIGLWCCAGAPPVPFSVAHAGLPHVSSSFLANLTSTGVPRRPRPGQHVRRRARKPACPDDRPVKAHPVLPGEACGTLTTRIEIRVHVSERVHHRVHQQVHRSERQSSHHEESAAGMSVHRVLTNEGNLCQSGSSLNIITSLIRSGPRKLAFTVTNGLSGSGTLG